MREKHKHCEIIKAWADGAEIQRFYDADKWHDDIDPTWAYDEVYRIKPEKKPDVVAFMGIEQPISIYEIIKDHLQSGKWSVYADHYIVNHCPHQLKLTFDGETGKLKSAEVIS